MSRRARRHVIARYQTVGPRGRREVSAPEPIGRCVVYGKRQYATEDQALLAGVGFQQHNQFVMSSRSVYKCAACGKYHLTGGK